MVLLRRLVGDVLRRHRLRQGRTLREVSAAAQVSLGYLSEVERGRKEASSELLAAICAALDVSLAEVLREVSDELVLLERGVPAPVGFAPVVVDKTAAAHRVAGVAPLLPSRPAPAAPSRAGAPVAVGGVPVATGPVATDAVATGPVATGPVATVSLASVRGEVTASRPVVAA